MLIASSSRFNKRFRPFIITAVILYYFQHLKQPKNLKNSHHQLQPKQTTKVTLKNRVLILKTTTIGIPTTITPVPLQILNVSHFIFQFFGSVLLNCSVLHDLCFTQFCGKYFQLSFKQTSSKFIPTLCQDRAKRILKMNEI